MKINIESFTNPITEDILQKRDFQYPSGTTQVEVKIPDEVISLLNNINQSLIDIKNNQVVMNNKVNEIYQFLGNVMMGELSEINHDTSEIKRVISQYTGIPVS